ETRDRTDGGRVRVEEEVLPQRLDAIGIASDQLRSEMVAQQRDDRRPASADRVRVADALRAIVAGEPHDRRLLLDECLDRVGAHDRWLKVDLKDLDRADCTRCTHRTRAFTCRKRAAATTRSAARR